MRGLLLYETKHGKFLVNAAGQVSDLPKVDYDEWLITTYELPHDKTNIMTVRPVKTQISLGIRLVWSESSLGTHWVAKDPSFLHADSKDSDQTGRMPRLIWVFAGCTCHFVEVAQL